MTRIRRPDIASGGALTRTRIAGKLLPPRRVAAPGLQIV
jgi:hypothetical protein